MDMALTRRACTTGALLCSALIAAVITERAAVSPPADVPGSAAALERIDSGHAVVDTYVKDVKEARLAANREADAQLAMSRHQTAAEAALRATDTRAAASKTPRVAAATPLPQPSPVAVHPQLQVAQVTQEASPPPAKRPVLARVVSTVTRIPGWVSSNVVDAAAWVVELPGQVVRLPERRFL
jgi:hypothetical protein